MEIYKPIKNLTSKARRFAAIGIIATLPYICESCSYKGSQVNAKPMQEITKISQTTPVLETILEK